MCAPTRRRHMTPVSTPAVHLLVVYRNVDRQASVLLRGRVRFEPQTLMYARRLIFIRRVSLRFLLIRTWQKSDTVQLSRILSPNTVQLRSVAKWKRRHAVPTWPRHTPQLSRRLGNIHVPRRHSTAAGSTPRLCWCPLKLARHGDNRYVTHYTRSRCLSAWFRRLRWWHSNVRGQGAEYFYSLRATFPI